MVLDQEEKDQEQVGDKEAVNSSLKMKLKTYGKKKPKRFFRKGTAVVGTKTFRKKIKKMLGE